LGLGGGRGLRGRVWHRHGHGLALGGCGEQESCRDWKRGEA
jgi:hypothetical protein